MGGTRSKVNGLAAAAWLRAQGRLQHHGACLHYVWQAYKAQGASTARGAQTALQAWHLTLGRHEGDWNPPAGVPVWFGAKQSSAAGDVVISLGNGLVVCTDYPYYGVVGVCTIAQRQAQIGRPYLGWSEAIFDQPIDFSSPSGGGNAAPIEEDEMNEDDRNLLKSIATKQGEIDARQKRLEEALLRDATLTGGSTKGEQTLFGLLRSVATAITRLATVLGGSVKNGVLDGDNVIDRLRSIEKKFDGKS